MLGRKRALLKVLINKQFSEGINKADLLKNLERFIDQQYPESIENKYLTHRKKTALLDELSKDIHEAGGLVKWKNNLILRTTPIIGSLPHKNKEKHNAQNDQPG